MTTPRVLTDEELMQMPQDGRKYELVDGALVVSPAGGRHGKVTVRLVVRLGGFVEAANLGHIFDSSTGYILPGGNRRAPDVSFVARGRFPGEEVPRGFIELPPDLAVEVLSPGDDPRRVMDKVGEYLQSGVRLVWVIDPETRRAVSYRSLTAVRDVPSEGSLDGEDVVPGFACPVASLFK
jgi:Uma2 family endonuclease